MAPRKKVGKSANGTAKTDSSKDKAAESACSITGVLTSHPLSRDLQFDQVSLLFYATEIICDTRLELNHGRRYGLIGPNGSGKSALLRALGQRELGIPDHIDVFLLENEYPATDMTALEAVVHEIEQQRQALESQVEEVMEAEGPESALLEELYDRLSELDVDMAEKNAAEILFGLGFVGDAQLKKTKEFSGGWRMRIALAKALFIQPALLLLDEPTNHLDLESCVWLEDYLKNYKRCLVMISHSQDFLNGVCTNIIHLHQKKLCYYSGNYDTYVRTRAELEENQMKKYNAEQAEIANIKDFVARFGHGTAKLARQAQSREKVLAKMTAAGLTEKVVDNYNVVFKLNDVGKLPPPVLQFDDVSFGYPGTGKILYQHLHLGVDLDSRVALVGPNGAGKSTLLKLMAGELESKSGVIKRNSHLKFARYHQHLQDLLDPEISPIEFMIKHFPDDIEQERVRASLGKFGLTGRTQTSKIRNLSDGQKSRVVFAWIAKQSPHILLLDEPTNHLDIETIDALANAINSWDGGMILVSHDFRLISQVAKEIWLCDKGKVSKWKGDILTYKAALRAQFCKAH